MVVFTGFCPVTVFDINGFVNIHVGGIVGIQPFLQAGSLYVLQRGHLVALVHALLAERA